MLRCPCPYLGLSGRHLLPSSFSVFDPRRTSVAIASIIADTTEAERNVDALGSSLTPEHLMDYEQAATAPLQVSQPGVEIAGMLM
jgi:hypothetical protein